MKPNIGFQPFFSQLQLTISGWEKWWRWLLKVSQNNRCSLVLNFSHFSSPLLLFLACISYCLTLPISISRDTVCGRNTTHKFSAALTAVVTAGVPDGLDMHKSVGAHGMHPWCPGSWLMSLIKVYLWINFHQSLQLQKVPEDCRKRKYYSCLEEGQGGSRELQANQPHLDPWKGPGVANPWNYFQENHMEWPAWLHQVKFMFDQINTFLPWNF